jgi:hypothetical protein
MIQLTTPERDIIKLCKLHYQSLYPLTGKWANTLKPLFKKIYGWDPDEDKNYGDYLNCVFNKLLDIHLKIQNDKSGSNRQLRGIFEASFYKGITRDDELPIERAISELCGLIQSNTVLEEDGTERYTL